VKRLIVLVGILAAGLSGCADANIIGFRSVENHNASKMTADARPSAVQVNQITDANAHAMALALMAEIDYSANHDEEVKTPAN